MAQREIIRLDRRSLADHEIDLVETLTNSLTDAEQKAMVSILCDKGTARVTLECGKSWTLTNEGDDGWWADD